jgi:hypothetical protein
MWKGTHQHVHTDVGESDLSFTSILLAVEMDTPGTFILLAAEMDTPARHG